ncbi:MAG TPA: abortive phage infection protein [Firmicutes bacterium]|nr:abortive phage infection protein [Bacillota bacterium]
MVEEKTFKENINKVKKNYNLSYYEVLQRYMFERILERISLSKYRDNFVLKGGLLLSAIFGIDNRTTKDMDTTIKGIDIDKDKMINVLNEILSIDINDSVKFEIENVNNIRKTDKYGGNKYHIIGKVFNISVNLEIDISTGDSIIPKELKYKYKSLFDNKYFYISSYNIETLLSEKIETVLRRGIFNSRMKDYYDIYFFLTKLKNEINFDILKKSINNTFKIRESFDYLNDYNIILNNIRNNDKIHNLWKSYSKKNEYSKNISFDDIIDILIDFINELSLELVV